MFRTPSYSPVFENERVYIVLLKYNSNTTEDKFADVFAGFPHFLIIVKFCNFFMFDVATLQSFARNEE